MVLKLEVRKPPEIASIAVSGGSRHDGILVGGFAIETTFDSGPKLFVGTAAVRDTNCLYALGLVRFMKEQARSGRNSMSVFAPHRGFEMYAAEHFQTWLDRNNRNADGRVPECFAEWKYLFTRTQDGRLKFVDDVTASAWALDRFIKGTHLVARQAATVGESLGVPGKLGLLASGHSLEEIGLVPPDPGPPSERGTQSD